jgi:deoxycytidylate deaminase
MRFFTRACLAMKKSTHHTPTGCVIVSGNYVVSEGFNQKKSHTIQHRNDRKVDYHAAYANIHAEVNALIKSKFFDLSNCELYLYREDKLGMIANSRPCISCMPALITAGVRHLYYTDKFGYCYERVG